MHIRGRNERNARLRLSGIKDVGMGAAPLAGSAMMRGDGATCLSPFQLVFMYVWTLA